MKFEVNTANFKKLLKPVISGAYRADSVWFNAVSDRLEVTVVTKADVTVLVIAKRTNYPELQYVCRNPGAGALNAGELQNHLSTIRSANFSIEFPELARIVSIPDEEEQSILMRNVITQDTVVTKSKSNQRFSIDARTLRNGISAVKYAMGSSETRPLLCGMVLELGEGTCRFMAGHGPFYTEKSIKNKKLIRNKNAIRIFLSSKSIGPIITALSAIPNQLLQCSLAKDKLVITGRQVQLYITTQPESAQKYPNFDKILNYDYPHKLCVNMYDFTTAVKGMDGSFSKKDMQSGDIPHVQMAVDTQSGLIILTKDSNGAKALRKIPLALHTKFSDAPDSIEFQCEIAFLTNVCKYYGDAKELIIHCENYKKPILIEPVNRAGKTTGSGNHDFIFFAICK